ncbi:glucoamylase family protein [Penaeicola halotolerans]|uniref:glucoamylase family protein n=1 Tax=Penaeicola halotolerans TaxID=2793196 RepID=UPI001CF84F26|nr:glucoamylase family protein [Penaeicola halotolerans]
MKYLLKYCIVLFLIFTYGCKSETELPQNPTTPPEVSNLDTLQFIRQLKEDTFHFFWDIADNETGLIPDRAPTESFSSIAAVGFGLTAYIVGVENGYISRFEAVQRVKKTLEFLKSLPQSNSSIQVGGYKGFFYHFLDMNTGYRYREVELSTIDTALLMAGILSCQSYFDGDTEDELSIRNVADELYRAVDWQWAMNDKAKMSLGWIPEEGFLPFEWTGYNEAMILYILGLGSPTYPLDESVWPAWTSTYEVGSFQGFTHINFGPLFGHQYSHIYIDFRGINDDYTATLGFDYFENSRRATLSNRAYCIENPGRFRGYSENIWGLTASDGPGNVQEGGQVFYDYRARGAARNYQVDDGTIAPTAAGGSYAFTPEESKKALSAMYSIYGDRLYGAYGFKDAFNPTYIYGETNAAGWIAKDYLGIDQGPILLMIENHESELIWSVMKKNPYIRNGLIRAGFEGGWIDE